MPRQAVPVVLSVRGTPFTFTAYALTGFAEAAPFIEYLTDRGGVSHATMTEYVRQVARLKREGRLGDPARWRHRVETTAANAYWQWVGDNYEARVQPVIKAIPAVDMRRAVRWLRRGALVPPYPGKMVPRVVAMPKAILDTQTREAVTVPAATAFTPCDTWTLHVPADQREPHTDPCATCTVLDLTPVQVETIAAAFERAWGHRDLQRVPAEYPLFGEPPRSDRVQPDTPPVGRVVALCEPGAVADSLRALGAVVTGDVDAFLARQSEGFDAVHVSRRAAGARWAEVLAALDGGTGVQMQVRVPATDTAELV